ncbi:MAG TPA: hypothetical protein VGL83_01705 [Stellaceae bacterium]|jgi:hypothetical protein
MIGRALGTAALASLTTTMAWAQATPSDPPSPVALDNAYVHVARDTAPCAVATAPGCEDRVIVAISDIEVTAGKSSRRLHKGQVAVFKKGDSYRVSGAQYFEVAIKPDHPAVKSPAEMIAPAKNQLIYDGPRFFIYEEKLAPGDIRPRHSHSQRVEIRLNIGPLLDQWFDPPKPPVLPSIVNFREAGIHTTKNVGDMALRNLIVEFKPEPK